MSDQRAESAAVVEPYFDRTPQPFGEGPVEPLVYDASPRALRQRTVNFAAKRLVDMRYVSRLERSTAERHFWWRPTVARPAPEVARALDAFFAFDGRVWGPDRHPGAHPLRTLQRIRRRRSPDPELVDDEGCHDPGPWPSPKSWPRIAYSRAPSSVA